MKCINIIRLGHKTYETCNGNLIASVVVEVVDYDCLNHIVIDIKCDKCNSAKHSNLADIEEIYNLDKFLTDYIARS